MPFLVILFILGLMGVVVAGIWKAFEKAGQPGWAALVPVYNLYVMTQIAGKPGWWVILCILPCIGVIAMLLIFIDIAKAFGKGAGFGIGLWLLGFIFWPLLGFGDAQYEGAKA